LNPSEKNELWWRGEKERKKKRKGPGEERPLRGMRKCSDSLSIGDSEV
jgi:hypothetical protein